MGETEGLQTHSKVWKVSKSFEYNYKCYYCYLLNCIVTNDFDHAPNQQHFADDNINVLFFQSIFETFCIELDITAISYTIVC